MDSKSYLNPGSLKAQCDKAITKLNKDNDTLDIVLKHFEDVIDNKELKGKAYDGLKKQLGDYRIIISNMKEANEFDIEDFTKLTGLVGEKILNGDTILDLKKNSYDEYKTDSQKAEDYEKQSNESNLPLEKIHYKWKSESYSAMAEIENKMYKKCINDEEEFDHAESKTKNLFEDSTMLRQKAQEGLEALSKSFSDGVYHYDKKAKWRESLETIHYNMLMDTSDGKVKPHWDMIKRVLSRKASDISDQEYAILTEIYLSADDKDMAKFIGCFMSGKDVKTSILKASRNENGSYLGQNYKVWKVDEEKLRRIISIVSINSNNVLEKLRGLNSNKDTFQKMQNERNILLQKLTLLSVVQNNKEYRGEYRGKVPYIKVNYQEDGSLNMCFKMYKNIASDWNRIWSELGESQICISDTNNGVNTMTASLKNGEIDFYGHFGNFDEEKEIASIVLNEGTSKIMERGVKEANSQLVKAIPGVGNAIGLGIGVALDMQEVKENSFFIKGQFSQFEVADIYSDFDCSTNIVRYEDNGKGKTVAYAYEGILTKSRVEKVGKKTGLKISVNEVIGNPNKIYGDIEKYKKKKGNKDLYNNAIEEY